jgi:hypothetical protein
MTERMNIRRMQMPEKVPESATFDPETDITAKDWQNITEQFARARERGRSASEPYYPARFAESIHTLDPAKIIIHENDIRIIATKLEEHREAGGHDFSFYALRLRTLADKNPMLRKEDWEKMQRSLDELRTHAINDEDFWWDFAESAAIMHALDPNQPLLTEDDWKGMAITLNSFRLNQDWQSFVSVAASLKVLNPIADLVTEEDWKNLRAYLKDRKQRPIDEDFVNVMADLKVLAPRPKGEMDQVFRAMPETGDLPQ